MPDPCTCGAEIMFMKTENGKAMPYRPDTSEMRLVRFTKGGKSYGKMVQTWVPHWADCPDAENFKPEAEA